MAVVAERYDHVGGVDTHARTHTYAVVAARTGALIETATFPTSAAAIERALAWMTRKTAGEVLVAAEGTASYGARMTSIMTASGWTVREVKPPRRRTRAGGGKSDPIDAVAAARSILSADHEALAQPRAEGLRAALRVLLAARRSLDVQRTADRNALTALVRTVDLGMDVRPPLTDAQVSGIASWRIRTREDTAMVVTRAEAKRLATGILRRTRELTDNQRALSTHVNSLAKGLQDISGVGPVTAAIILTAYSHRRPGAVRGGLRPGRRAPMPLGHDLVHIDYGLFGRRCEPALDALLYPG
jgi:transposase